VPPHPFASGGYKGSAPRTLILYCKFFFLYLPTRTDSFGIDQKILCSCNYSGSAPAGFRRRKINTALLMIMTTVIIIICNYNYRFQFFSFCSPTHFALASPLSEKKPILLKKQILRKNQWVYCSLSNNANI